MSKHHTPPQPRKNAPSQRPGAFDNADALPKGCSLVQWKNQDGTQETRYRVRVARKNLKINKLVLTLEEAKLLLGVSENLTNNHGKYSDEMAEKINFLISNDLEVEILHHIKSKFALKTTEKDSRQKSAELSRIKTISKTPIFIGEKRTNFGSFSIYEIKRKHLLAYCEARDKPDVSQETIKRELSLLQGFFKSKLNSSVSVDMFDQSPFAGFSYHYKYAYERKEKVRLTDEQEQALFNELSKNEKMFDIAKIALLTGMRKSEILFLTQKQITDDKILLQKQDTKTRKARKILLLPDVKAILSKYKTERLFNYTIDGFNANWRRICKNAGLDGFNFHSLRAEFISRIIALDLNNIQKQQLSNIISYKYFEKTYLNSQAQTSLETIEDVAKQVGHSSLEVTSSTYVKSK